MQRKNLLVIHGGAPTAVMNASLYGVLKEARRFPQVGSVLGASYGTGGLLKERFVDLSTLPESDHERLLMTPGSVIGTSRTPLYDAEYRRIKQILVKHDIGYVLFNGGNGTMDACGRTHQICAEAGIPVVGIPKTIDNDIAMTDHTPGYGSAARFVSTAVADICQDIHSLPIHVCVVEVMGRNAGWLTASASLASDVGYGPDLIYLPECNFCEEAFLNDVKTLHEQKGGVVVVVSEGLHDEKSMPLVPSIFQTDRAIYYGDVGAHLANRVIQKLGIKARSEKPGICCRAALELKSPVDLQEAVLCGRHAVQLALEGVSGVMVTLERSEPYQIHTGHVPIEHVMLTERQMPKSFINARENGVTEAFLDWCRPLIGNRPSRFLPIQNQRF